MGLAGGLRIDMVVLLRLHAVLDSVVEIEALLAEIELRQPVCPTHRMTELATELRALVRGVLCPARTD